MIYYLLFFHVKNIIIAVITKITGRDNDVTTLTNQLNIPIAISNNDTIVC